jgi:hypothetical protein
MLVNGVPEWLSGRPPMTEMDRRMASEAPGKGFLRRERLLRQLGRSTIRIYATHWPLWMVLGAVMVPVSIGVSFLEQALGLDWIVDGLNSTAMEPVSELIGMSAGAFIGATLVSVTVFAAMRDLDEGNRPTVPAVYRRVLDRGPAIIGEVVSFGLAIGLLSLIVIGIPVAINRAVAWAVGAQAVVFEDRRSWAGLKRSAELVKGSWWRVLGIIVLIALFVGLPGPLIVFGFMVFTRPPLIQAIYPLLSALYILVLFPVGFIASSLLYGDLCAVRERRREVEETGGGTQPEA